MANISLSFTNNKKNNFLKNSSKEKVYLKYYPEVDEQPERYTYIDSNGNEEEFTDTSYHIYKTSLTKGEAKKVILNKIPLKFNEGVPEIKYKPAYFTYNVEEIFLDKPQYDEELNSYIGIIKKVNIIDKEIQIFEY